MSLLASFQSGLKEACLDYRDCCGPLIITCSSLLLLICSAECTHRWILMPWRMIAACVCVCVPHEHTQTDADRRQKLERHTHKHTKTNTHTLACSLCFAKWDGWASSSTPWRKESLIRRTHRNTHTSLPSLILYHSGRRMGREKNQF